jgi:hypothetical protein
MSKALSVDLRERVVAAVAAGASCRAAAIRFHQAIRADEPRPTASAQPQESALCALGIKETCAREACVSSF